MDNTTSNIGNNNIIELESKIEQLLLIIAEKQKEIEDDIVPIGIIDSGKGGDTFEEDGDVWTVVDDGKNYGVF